MELQTLLSPKICALLKELGVTSVLELQTKGAAFVYRELQVRQQGLTQAIYWRLAALEMGRHLSEIDAAEKKLLATILKATPKTRLFPDKMQLTHYMTLALEEARCAQKENEVPVGAVAVYQGKVIARGHNRVVSNHFVGEHAEMIALREVGKILGNYRLEKVDLYVTVEPCMMCLGAITAARIGRLIYGVKEPKTGVTDHHGLFRCTHTAILGGVLAKESAALLQEFFQIRRQPAFMAI